MSAEAKRLAWDRYSGEATQHAARIRWLESADPCWSCGTPVALADRTNLAIQSRARLQQLAAMGYTTEVAP